MPRFTARFIRIIVHHVNGIVLHGEPKHDTNRKSRMEAKWRGQVRSPLEFRAILQPN